MHGFQNLLAAAPGARCRRNPRQRFQRHGGCHQGTEILQRNLDAGDLAKERVHGRGRDRDNFGTVRAVSTTTVNAFLREIAGIKISLKDFRTLMASAVALKSLSRITPAASARGRRKQVLEAVRAAADELSNTPAICRKSYVHDTIVTAFEDGILERFAATMKGTRSQSKREQLLAQVVTAAAV